MVGRQLHDKGGHLTLEQGVLQHQSGEHGKADTDQIEQKHQVLATGGEEGRCKQRIDRHTGAAGHEGIHHHRQGAVALVLQGTRGHDRRYVAAKADQHRHEGLARQADETHEAVHDKGGAGHVAGVLQKGEEKKHETNRRDEGGHGLDATADASGKDGHQPFRCPNAFEQLTKTINKDGAGELVEKIDEGAAQVDGEHEHHIHGHQKNRQAQHAAEHHRIDTVGEGGGEAALFLDQVLGQPGDKAVAGGGDDDIGFLVLPGFDLLAQFAHLGLNVLAEDNMLHRCVVIFQQFQRQPAGIDFFHGTQVLQVLGQAGHGLLHGHRVDHLGTGGMGSRSHLDNGTFQLLDALILGGRHGHHRTPDALG